MAIFNPAQFGGKPLPKGTTTLPKSSSAVNSFNPTSLGGKALPKASTPVDNTQPAPQDRNMLQGALGGFLDAPVKLINEGVKGAGKAVARGVEMFQSPAGKANTEANINALDNAPTTVPGLGTQIKPQKDIGVNDV